MNIAHFFVFFLAYANPAVHLKIELLGCLRSRYNCRIWRILVHDPIVGFRDLNLVSDNRTNIILLVLLADNPPFNEIGVEASRHRSEAMDTKRSALP